MSPAELRALLEHELERAKSTLAYCRREVRAEERRVAAEAARYADAVTAACAVFGETVPDAVEDVLDRLRPHRSTFNAMQASETEARVEQLVEALRCFDAAVGPNAEAAA